MKNFQSAIIFTLIILTFAVSGFSQTDNRASKTWEVQKYDITATLPTTETDRFLNVKAVLNLKNASGSAASSLTLRISPNAEISGVKINNATADFSKGEEKVGSGTLQRIILRGVSVASGGTSAVEVTYKLKVAENSGVNALSPAGSQFLPLAFWYPTPNSWYFSRGADFAPVHLQVNSPNGQTAVASGMENGGAFDQKINGQPFFITGNWDALSANDVSVLMPKGADANGQKRAGELATLVADAKTFTANLLGTVPDSPLRIVAARRGAGFSSGGTILIDENVFRRQKIDSVTAMTIAEAVAKMWLGGSVKIDGDGNGAIREGLPRFIATQFLESKYGKEIADIERLRQRTTYAAIVKRETPLNLVSPLDDYYFTTNTNKGAMIWRLLSKKVGQDEFFNVIKANIKDGTLNLAKLREAFSSNKDFLDYAFDQATDMDLIVGLPQSNGADTKVALRNTGSIDASVEVTATATNGEKNKSSVTIAKQSFGEVVFKPTSKIVRVEVDADKIYPQLDYSDDVAPREFDESDLLLFTKKPFDKQDYFNAEKNARLVLRDNPRFDDVRVLLARSLLAQNKTADSEKEFRAVLDEKLPTSRSLAWANVGLGEIALKSNQTAQSVQYFNEAIKADAEYGATLAARQGKSKANVPLTNDESIKGFFAQFDKAAISGRKADLDAMVLAGEIPRFSGGIAGQAQEWTTQILQIEKINANQAIVETNLNVKLLNKSPESGTAVYRLTMVGNGWKLSGVEVFEVR